MRRKKQKLKKRTKQTLKSQASDRKPLPINSNQERFTLDNGLELYGMGLEFKKNLVS
jgi:hypothetical protein